MRLARVGRHLLDPPRECLLVARPDPREEPQRERPDVVRADPSREIGAKQATVEQAHAEDRRHTGVDGEGLIVMDRMEVTAGARVPHEIGAGQRSLRLHRRAFAHG